jgi:hypothetical protein
VGEVGVVLGWGWVVLVDTEPRHPLPQPDSPHRFDVALGQAHYVYSGLRPDTLLHTWIWSCISEGHSKLWKGAGRKQKCLLDDKFLLTQSYTQ